AQRRRNPNRRRRRRRARDRSASSPPSPWFPRRRHARKAEASRGMNDYGVADVERLLGLSASTIRAFVEAGFVKPARGPRNALRFSFQDLIVLRTAQGLAQANVPQRRIVKAVRELRRNLPATMPLSGLSITAVADQLVVREGAKRWQAD